LRLAVIGVKTLVAVKTLKALAEPAPGTRPIRIGIGAIESSTEAPRVAELIQIAHFSSCG